MAGAEEQRTQAYCPRCGFIPRVPRTTCPVCARALVARGPEGIDDRRSPAGTLLVLGAGLAIVAGGLAVAVLDNDTDFGEINAGIPQLMPPDSGVLGISESGGDEKDRRDGEERSGKLGDDDGDGDGDGGGDGDGDGDGDDGDRAGSGVEVDDRRRPKDVGDMANIPPLLPPIGSDDPDGGSPVPPLDGAPGMPPPLVPVADIGGDSSGSDDDSDDNDGDGGDSRAGEHTVVLASEDSERRALVLGDGGEQSVLAIEETGLLAIVGRAAAALADDEPEVPVGVFEACDLPGYEDGELIAFAGRFDAERNANKLLERLREFEVGEDVLFVPDDKADRCPGSELVDDGDEIDPRGDLPEIASGGGGESGDVPNIASGDEGNDLRGDLPDQLGDLPDLAPGSSDDGEAQPEPEESAIDKDADEDPPADEAGPGRD